MFMTTLLALVVLALPKLDRVRRASAGGLDEPLLYATVHSELMAGATLRHALTSAADGQTSSQLHSLRRALSAVAPDKAVADCLRSLPLCGGAASVAFLVASESGGAAAGVFLRLADRAATALDLARQQRTLTAQARLSAVIVGGLPFLWLLFGGWHRLALLISVGGAGVAVAGLLLQAIGVLVIWRVAS